MSRATFRVRNTSGRPIFAVLRLYSAANPSSNPLNVCSLQTINGECSAENVWPIVLDGGEWYELIANAPKSANSYLLTLHTEANAASNPVKSLSGSLSSGAVSKSVEIHSINSSGWAIAAAIVWTAFLIVLFIVLVLLIQRLVKTHKCKPGDPACPI